MKFKREDVGLYFSLSLLGAGVGLLVGAYIASRMEGDEELVEFVVQEENLTPKIPRKKKPRKKGKKELTSEQKTFVEQWAPSPVQIEMLRNGIVNMDELENILLKEELAKEKEPYDYRGEYTMYEIDPKPDLEDLAKLPEDEGLVDDRFEFYQGEFPKEGGHPKKFERNKVTIFYDPDGEDFFRLSRKNTPVPIGSLDTIMSEEAWESLKPYLLSGFSPIFVDDTKTNKYYQFEVVDREEVPIDADEGD